MKTTGTSSKVPLGERVYEDLRAAIVLGELASGRVFNESDLVRRYGVSTSPLKEALTRLRQDGLVRVIPRRGYAVTELTLRDFHELVQMRLIVEGAAAELAAPRIADEHIEELQRLSAISLKIADPATYRPFMQANQSFHERIAEIADNKRLLKVTKQTFDDVQRLLFAGLHEQENEDLTHDHDAIIASLARRDGLAARNAVVVHVKQSRDRVIARMLRTDARLERLSVT